MAWEDDVMVPDGVRQEIRNHVRMRQLDNLLGSAQVWLRLVTDQFALFDEGTGQIARHFEDGDGPFLHIASDANADARFKMGVELIPLNHIKRYGAMGKQHLARLWVDAGRIGLEAADTKQRLGNLHGEHRRNIALAACHNPLCIEFAQSQTTRVVNSRQQIETTDGEALKLMPFNHRFQGIIYLIGYGQGRPDGIG